MISETFLLDIADFIGIASFGLSGFYVATKDRLDILGIFIASFLTALGGGIIRDLIVNATPFAFSHAYPSLIVIVVLIFSIWFKLHKSDKILKSKLLILSDSIGLVSFSISGALVGLGANFSVFGVCLLAIITAAGGGIMRDILLNKIPLLLTSELYGTISILIGFTIYILNFYGMINFATIFIVFFVALVGRLVAFYKKWHLPYLSD
ncbi:MAG: trimeric intracellular cation channel family protein [Epsilonproteobacteria bacterium]|nr:trimeric intracellular cation channel family protein [Campylobacterota bacterium]